MKKELILGALLGAMPLAGKAQETRPVEKLNKDSMEQVNNPDSVSVSPDFSKKKNISWRAALETNLDLVNENQGAPKVYSESSQEKSATIENSSDAKEVLNIYKERAKMMDLLNSLPPAQRNVEGFIGRVKESFPTSSFEAKIQALSMIDGMLYCHYSDKKKTEQVNQDDIIKHMAAYLNEEEDKPFLMGDCRAFSSLTAKIAEEGLGLSAAVVTGRRHDIVQVVGPDKNLTLITSGLIFNQIDGRPLKNKDDVDIAIMHMMGGWSSKDITIHDDEVVYYNRYNNFAGFWNKLQNVDNTDRNRKFLMDNENLSLFAQLDDEKGVTRGEISKGNIGLQAYWVRGNNNYNRFIEGIQGANIAAYFSADSTNDSRLKNSFFANLGFYHSVLNFSSVNERREDQKRTDIAHVQGSFEDYLKYSLNTNLTVGMISKLIQFDQELWRSEGEKLLPEGGFSLSPFISFEIPKETGKTYLCAGTEVTDHLALPNALQFSQIPWFQAGFKYSKRGIDFDASLKGEFQKASQRFDWVSYLKKESNTFQLRAFYEHYTQEFKKYMPIQDGKGIEAGIARDLKKGHQAFIMISFKSDNTGQTNLVLNLGLKF
ncbi:MAG: hypothetical protein WC458_02615 [Patescibacteria group bacterium]